MKDIILKNVEKLEPEIIEAISKSVSYESVLDEDNSIPGAPFGKKIDDCLNNILELCESLGFKTYKDVDGYYGYADIGEGDELVGILGHLDVVPAGVGIQYKKT